MIAYLYGRIGMFCHYANKLKSAEKWYRGAMRMKTKNLSHMTAYGVLLLRLDRYQESIEVFNRALELEPKLPVRCRIRINRAIAYFRLGELERAILALEDVHQIHPDALTFQTLGYLYIVKHEWQKALDFNLSALNYDPTDAIILDNLGQIYEATGDRAKAKEFYLKSHDSQDSKLFNLYHLAHLSMEEGDLDKAWEYVLKGEQCKSGISGEVTPKMVKDLKLKIESMRQI